MGFTDGFRAHRTALLTVLVLGLGASPAQATHFRYGHITWDVGSGNTIEFTIQDAWRRDAYNNSNSPDRCVNTQTNTSTACTGSGGNPAVGDVIHERQGGSQFDPGDGSGLIGSPVTIGGSDALLYLVTSIDAANNWLFGVALDPGTSPQPVGCGLGNTPSTCDTTIEHTYATTGNFVAKMDDCCRISPCVSPTAHINNPDNEYHVATTVNVGAGNTSPVSALPPIILCPTNALCQFTVPVSDNELDTVEFRMSTSAEAGFNLPVSDPGQGQPGTAAGCATNASIGTSSGLYSWDTTGCTVAGDPTPVPPNGGCNQPSFNTCYSTQVKIEETTANGDVAVDFLICLTDCPPSNNAPSFDPPSPCGQTLSVNPGDLLSFTVEASDGDTADDVELNVAGLPSGASMTPALPTSGDPVSSDFDWTPNVGDIGQHVVTFTATDECGAQELCSVTIDVSQEDCTDGMDNDGDTLIDCQDPDCDQATCDDGLFCTVNDTCQMGVCMGAPHACNDGNACTDDSCNESTNMCDNDPEPLSTPCEADANLCTTDHCNGSGMCVFQSNVSCQAPSPPCEGGAVCNPGTGMCVPQPDAAPSTPCNADANACTVDHCNGSGACVFQSNVSCQAPSPPCEGGEVCNPTNGMCVPQPDAASSTPCNLDANLCTTDHCNGSGMCVFQSNVSCQAPNPPCEGGAVCNPGTGACVPQPDAASSTPCNADANLCTTDHCNGSGMCVFQSNVSCQAPSPPCEGGAVCNTMTGVCDPQPDAALSTPCNADGNACTVDHCNGSGACVLQSNLPISTPCNLDANLCTVDHCNGSGTCVFQSNVSCQAPSPPCEGGSLCNPTTGTCVTQPDAALSTPCELDGNDCTLDHCNGTGSCALESVAPPGTPCNDDGDACTLDQCDENGMCAPFAGGSDHFKCYKTAQLGPGFGRIDVSLEDQFGASAATVTKPQRFCNPADKNGEGIADPTAHLMCYKIRDSGDGGQEVIVENQFGEQRLTINRADTLCVPAEKDMVPSPLNLNHFKCYKVKPTKDSPKWIEREVTVADQFEDKDTRLIKPSFLCTPVDKNGEGIPCEENHLVCYRIKDVGGQASFTRTQVDITDQFNSEPLNALRGDCRKSAHFCVPSTKRIASPSGAFVEMGTSLLD